MYLSRGINGLARAYHPEIPYPWLVFSLVRSDRPQVELRFDPRESRLTSKVCRDVLVPTVCAAPRHLLMASRGS